MSKTWINKLTVGSIACALVAAMPVAGMAARHYTGKTPASISMLPMAAVADTGSSTSTPTNPMVEVPQQFATTTVVNHAKTTRVKHAAKKLVKGVKSKHKKHKKHTARKHA